MSDANSPTAESDGATPALLGTKLKHTRMMLGLSLKEVAARANLTEGFLSKIENDRANPTMATLHRLVLALDTNMSSLFAATEHGDSEVFVLPAAARPIIETGHRRTGNNVRLEKLVPTGAEYLLQINIHVVAPRGGSEELIRHKGQEFGFVLQGALELMVEKGTYQLKEGDSFYFNSELGHGYRNKGTETARVLWVNTPPTF